MFDVKKEIAVCWDGCAAEYDDLYGHGLKSAAEAAAWKEFLRTAIGTTPQRILDVGTGTGFLALLLAELGHEVTGIDLSDGMMEQGRKKAAARKLAVTFRTGDAETLPAEMESSFDVVINRHLLWTLLEPQKALQEWYRVLKPGGRVMIIDGNWKQLSAGDRLRRFFGNLLIAVTEFRNPWRQSSGYSAELNGLLPMNRADAALDPKSILKACGFAHIAEMRLTEIDQIERRAMPLKVRLTKNCHRHMLSAVKI